jgi:hypothetical protein
MTCIAIIGRPRMGKTLYMTYLAFIDYLSGSKIYTNYRCDFAERMTVDQMLDIPFNDLERHPKTLCIQEADKIFDSWLRGSEQRLLSSLTGQSGKRNLQIYFDTQFPNRVQNSLRQIVETEIECFCDIDYDTKEPIGFNYIYRDIYDGTEKTTRLPAILFSTPDLIIKNKRFYDIYDSYEPTSPLTTEHKKTIRKRELEREY